MLLLSMKTYPALLWTTCVLFAVESLTAPTTQADTFNPPAEDLTMLYGEKESRPATSKPTHKPAEVSVAAATESAALPTVETQEANSLKSGTVGLVVMSTAAETAATSDSGHTLLQTAKAEATAAGGDQFYNSTDKHAQDQSHQPSATTHKDTTAPPTSAAFTSTLVVSSPQPTSIIKPEVTSQLSSTASSHESTQIFNSPSASTAAAMTTNHTSEAAPVFHPTSMPGAATETSKTSTELPSTSHPSSATTVLTPTGARGSSSTPTSVSTDPPSSTVSNSSAGVVVPRDTKKLPVSTSIPTPATTAAPRHVTKGPSSTEAQPCSTRSLARNCLIIIAVLAALATVFMVSTVVLCTKLSAKKYRAKKPQQETEMMCISALLKEPSYSYTRHRNPVRNGVLVIPGGGDSDDDLGDSLTLSSFLPENDRYV